MNEITIGVLTISDRCARKESVDESGPALVQSIGEGIIKNGRVVGTHFVPDSKGEIERVLKEWCDKDISLVLTTGGTGLSERDVTPEATEAVAEKIVPGISHLIFKHSSEVTPLAALSRGVAGVRGKSLIVNLPGSKKASKECLEAVAGVIPHAVDLIRGRNKEVESVHLGLKKKSSVVPGLSKPSKISYPCISVGQAQKILMENVGILAKRKVVSYKEALGHVLAFQVEAKDNLPLFDVSLMDGYAVRSTDKAAGRILVGSTEMGESPVGISVQPGTCVRVSTGGPIPPGADAVVKVEDTVLESLNVKEELTVTLNSLPQKNCNIRQKGSDFGVGQVLLTENTYLNPAAVGLLASAGITRVNVFAKPRVAVLSTGNEVINPEEDSKEKIRDSNRITLLSLLREENFEGVDLGIAADDPDTLRDSLERGFRAADVVVTTGSMSMGERDYMKDIIVADFNGEILFGSVFMKPGKPTSFGIVSFEGKPKLWFGLPGNPASAVVTSHLFLLPSLRKISMQSETLPKYVYAKRFASDDPEPCLESRPHYVRGSVSYKRSNGNGQFFYSVMTNQRSSWIGSLVKANCLILYPTKSEHLSNLRKVFLIGAIHVTD